MNQKSTISFNFEKSLWIFVLFLSIFSAKIIYSQLIQVLIIMLIPAYYFLLIIKHPSSLNFTIRGLISFFILSLLISYSSMSSIDPLGSILIVSIYYILFFSIWAGGRSGLSERMPNILSLYSVIGLTSIILIIALNGFDISTRLSYIRAPNSLALILISFLPGIAFFRNYLFISLFIVIFMLILIVSSRNGIIASTLFISILGLMRMWKYIKFETALLLAFFIIPILYFYFQFYLIDFFLADDEYRGLDTQFTGRGIAWLHAIGIIKENLFFGIGLGNSNYYFENISGNLGPLQYKFILTGVHNGYLALFMEFGLILGLILFFFLIKGLKAFIQLLPYKHSIIYISFFSGYFFFGIFEDVLLNTGNPASLIFLICIIIGLTSNKKRIHSESSIHSTKHSSL